MVKGVREGFRVELKPDFDQKRTWARVQDSARAVANSVAAEMLRQVRTLKFAVAKNLFLEGECGREDQGELSEEAFQFARSWAYDSFDEKAAVRNRRIQVPVLLEPKDVAFSVSDSAVRIPYLGLVRHRPNQFIVPTKGLETEEKAWLLANVTSMCLREVSYGLCLIVDCSGGQTKLLSKGKPKARRRKSRASKWLE